MTELTIYLLVFLAVAVLLLVRFFKTGGPEMLKMMGGDNEHEHDHTGHADSHDHRHGHRCH